MWKWPQSALLLYSLHMWRVGAETVLCMQRVGAEVLLCMQRNGAESSLRMWRCSAAFSISGYAVGEHQKEVCRVISVSMDLLRPYKWGYFIAGVLLIVELTLPSIHFLSLTDLKTP